MSGSDLDRFMLACSDLNQPARSRLFQNRPGLKDIKVQPRLAAPSAGFQTSQRARDWSQLDLGDAFSQAAPPAAPQQAGVADDADWGEFAEFQSCPPPAAGVSAHPGAGLPSAAAAAGSVDRPTSGGSLHGSGLTSGGGAAPLGYPGLVPLSASGLVHQTILTSPPGYHGGGPPSGQVGLLTPGAATPPGPAVGWPTPSEPAPAGYTPVPAVLPAAKPTRFRQGLVPQQLDPEEDEFAEFVAAESLPAAAPAERRRPETGRAVRPARLPTVDDSPPRRAASPPSEDVYTALRGLSVTPAAGRQQDLLGLDPPPPDTAGPAPDHRTPVPAPAAFSVSLVPTLCNLAAPTPSADSGRLRPTPAEVTGPPADLGGELAGSLAVPADEDEDFGEFVCVEQQQPAAAGGGEVSSRHGSLPSLDLQVAPASDGGEVSPLEPDRRDPDSASVRHDKYDSFRQEIICAPPSSCESALVAEWRRCLQACYELIQEGVALFGSVADQQTCSEVAASRQGAHYIDNLSRVYRVAGRIERACERHGCRHQLDFILSETCKAWANLSAFVANSPTRTSLAVVSDGWPPDGAPGEDQQQQQEEEEGEVSPCCGVCLLPAAATEVGRDEPTLACAGRHYHACCANLWVNRVADVLPALRP